MSDWEDYKDYEDEYAHVEPFTMAEIDEAFARGGPAVGGRILEMRAERRRAVEQAHIDSAQAQIGAAEEAKRATMWTRIGAWAAIAAVIVAIVFGYLALVHPRL